jgi:hypothetical protein
MREARPEAGAWPLRAIPVGSSVAGRGSVICFMRRSLTKRTDPSQSGTHSVPHRALLVPLCRGKRDPRCNDVATHTLVKRGLHVRISAEASTRYFAENPGIHVAQVTAGTRLDEAAGSFTTSWRLDRRSGSHALKGAR